MLLLAAFGALATRLMLTSAAKSALRLTLRWPCHSIGGFNIALDAPRATQTASCQRSRGGDIRQQLRRFYRTADFNNSFCHAPSPSQRIIQPSRIDGGVKIQPSSLTPSSPYIIGAVLTSARCSPDRPLHVVVLPLSVPFTLTLFCFTLPVA